MDRVYTNVATLDYDSIADSLEAAGSKSNNPDSLSQFETFLHCLEGDNGQHDTSTIRNCLNLVQRFQQERSGVQSWPMSDVASLTHDGSNSYATNLDSQGLSTSTSASGGQDSQDFVVMNEEAQGDVPIYDRSFEDHFNKVFSSDNANSSGGIPYYGYHE